MSSVVADTHAVVWFLTASPRLSSAAGAAMRDAIAAGEPVYVSAVTLVEITYLVERGRLPAAVRQLLLDTVRRPDAGVQIVAFDRDTAEALERVPRDVVPDMPDRMIAATAVRLNLPLVTADGQIRATGIPTIW